MQAPSASSKLGLGIVAGLVVVAGIGVVLGTTLIAVPPAFAKIGPTLFPYAIGVVLVVLGLFLVRDAVTGRWECEAADPETPRSDLVPLGWILAALVVTLVLIKPIGFILSSTISYALVAKGFGARRLWLAALVGLVLAFVAYFGFAEILGLRMGGGPIEDLF